MTSRNNSRPPFETSPTKRGRDLDTLVEEAVRRYLEVAAITGVQPADVAATQEKLAGEVTNLTPWTQPPAAGEPPEADDDATQ